jgi:nitrogen fixation protein FixH
MSTWDSWNADTPEGRRRSWIPYAFMAFFGVVVVVNSIMISVAIGTFSGIETKSHYVRGLNYNENLAAEAEQAARGWVVTKVLDDTPEALAAGAWPVSITLTDRDGRALSDAQVIARFLRPTSEGHDIAVALTETAPGAYRGLAELPLRGNWDLKVLVWHSDGTWQSTERVFINGRAN